MNEELSVFRPAWTQNNLHAYRDLSFCGVKKGYFDKTHGTPGHILEWHLARQGERRGR